ncbi:MAG: type II toxin-antitoxin system VapC family toxin [Terriglobales bacterium]
MIRVYWDTMLFAYWLEDSAEFRERVGQIHRAMQQRGQRLCASVFTLCELLVSPRRRQDGVATQRLQAFFASSELDLLSLAPAAAPHFAAARCAGASTGDAVHLAIAAAAGVDLFLTNDRRLQKLHVPGIAFIAGLDSGLY